MRACLAATAFVRDGELRMARPDAFAAALRRMPNCRTLVRVEQHLEPRTLALNAFWWGVLIHKIWELYT